MAMILRPFLLTVMAFVLWVLSLGLAGPVTAGEAALLTIAGDIKVTNRGKFDPFQDGFIAYHEKSFERAHQLTRKDLTGLPQSEITALGSAETWRAPVKLKGPLLKDVLALAGANGKPVTIFALDGYGAAFDVKMLDSRKWILAHTMDGQPLGIGGRGPLWLAYETGAVPVSAEEEAKWVWSVFFIEVGDK